MNKKKVKALLKGWKENEVVSCATTKFLATAQKTENGILLALYKRYQHYSHDPYAIIECKPEDFNVWYPEDNSTSKSAVFSICDNYAKMICNIHYYSGDTYADVTFAAKEDKDIAEKFFSAYRERFHDFVSEAKVKLLPSPWKEFVWYQIAVLDNRLKKRHSKRDQKRERLFSYLKEPTDGFKNWIWNKVMEDTQFIFYTPVTGSKVRIQCSVCGSDEVRNKSELQNFGRKNLGKCPTCGANVTYLPASVQPGWKNYEKRIGLMQKTPEGFVYRLFLASRVFTKKYLPEASDKIQEITRWFVSDDCDTGYLCEHGNWYERSDGWYYSDYLYPKTVKGAIADTKYRFCGIDQLAKPCVEMRHQIFLCRWTNFPVLEKVAKAGFYAAVKEYIKNSYYTSRILDTSKDDIFGALKLPRAEVRRIVKLKYQNSVPVIMTMQEAYEQNVSLRDEEIMEVTNINVSLDITSRRIEKLFKAIRMTGLTAHKVVKYITSEKKHYRDSEYQTSLAEALKDYDDYLDMAEYLGNDLHDRGLSMRSNLKKAHDEILEEYNTQVDRIRKEKEELEKRKQKELMAVIRKQIEANYSDAMHLRSDDLMLVGLWTPEDLIAEGKALHNCISTYPERVASGETMVMAVRKTKEPEKPYCAFEYKNDRIIQVRADHNAAAPEDVKAFVGVFHEMFQQEKKKLAQVAA